MEKILDEIEVNQESNNSLPIKHDRDTFLHAGSIMFQNAALYGLKAIIVLYIMSVESLNISRESALIFFGLFMGSFVVSKIIGGLIGDLILNSKKAIIVGGSIQALGAFILCIPHTTALYVGVGLISLGIGLFLPNFYAHFGKSYLSKTKLLDSGFTMIYIAGNIGSFFGVLLVGYIGIEFSWSIGFLLYGIFMLTSIFLMAKARNTTTKNITISGQSTSKKVINIAVIILLVAIYWAIVKTSGMRSSDIGFQLRLDPALNLPENFWDLLTILILLPIGIIAIIYWTKKFSNQFTKLALGFIFTALAISLLYFTPFEANNTHLPLYIATILLFAIAEIHLAPIIHSILTLNVNQKYLGIANSFAFLALSISSYIVSFVLTFNVIENIKIIEIIGISLLVIFGIGILIYGLRLKKNKSETSI